MPTATVNGVRLFYTLTGNAGPPLVLVHGSWADHGDWDFVVPALAERFRVLTYDRRGHSRSERPSGQGSLDEDVADLAALIEQLDLAPAHVVGHSSGGSIVLRLATRRPELFRSMSVQEPALLHLLAADPGHGPAMQETLTRIGEVANRLEAGNAEDGARLFIDSIALGPGVWEQFPLDVRQGVINNAATFLDETRDPAPLTVDLDALAAFPHQILLTRGDQSPAWFAPIVIKLATVLPHAGTRVFAGAGHLPMFTHPEEYAAAIVAFANAAETER
jgi:pimeloyl-ACP methyl ester carboxylesterase